MDSFFSLIFNKILPTIGRKNEVFNRFSLQP